MSGGLRARHCVIGRLHVQTVGYGLHPEAHGMMGSFTRGYPRYILVGQVRIQ